MTKILPVLALLAACTSMEPSASPLTPVRVTPTPTATAPTKPAQPAVPGAAVPPPADSPFAEDDPFYEGANDPSKPPSGTDAWLRLQLATETAAPPTPEVAVAEPIAPPVQEIPVWDGHTPLEGAGSWGVTLMTTMLDVQPPRAVLLFPDATERVVQPGTMVPDHNMVVLAIGRDAVQIAHVEPIGFMSRIQTTTVRKLSSGG